MHSRRALLRIAVGAAVTLPLALSGCGWTPLYADNEVDAADEELRLVQVQPIPERIGQQLALALRNSFAPAGDAGGEPVPKRYMLRTTLLVVRTDLGIQSEGLGTRGRLDVTATYTLSEIKSGALLLNNTTHVFESFDILPNEYATVVAEEDARTRAAEELRREITTRLTLFLQRRRAETAS